MMNDKRTKEQKEVEEWLNDELHYDENIFVHNHIPPKNDNSEK